MSRTVRSKGSFTTYHIIIRGNERKNIFTCEDDKLRFIDTIVKMKEKYNFIVEAYCLMDNHVHMIIDDNGNDISKIIKSINVSYVYYFNKVYKRVGHLFQDRFMSEIIDSDSYLTTVSAYIHNNPVKAGMVKRPEEYKWSSMNAYLGRDKKGLVNTERILDIYSKKTEIAINKYYEYVRKFEENNEIILDIQEDKIEIKRQRGDFIETLEQANKRFEEELKLRNVDVENLKKDKVLRKEIMEVLRKNSSLTLKEIGHICGGFAESTVSLILKGVK